MTAMTPPTGTFRLPSSTVRPARALSKDARRRGTRENPRLEDVAHTPLPEDSSR